MRAFVPLFCSITISFSQSGLDIAQKLDKKERPQSVFSRISMVLKNSKNKSKKDSSKRGNRSQIPPNHLLGPKWAPDLPKCSPNPHFGVQHVNFSPTFSTKNVWKSEGFSISLSMEARWRVRALAPLDTNSLNRTAAIMLSGSTQNQQKPCLCIPALQHTRLLPYLCFAHVPEF